VPHTDRLTDRQTDNIAVSISFVAVMNECVSAMKTFYKTVYVGELY